MSPPPPPSRVSDVAAGGDAQAAHARFHLGAQDGTKAHLLALKNFFILDAQRLIFLLMLQCPSVSRRSLGGTEAAQHIKCKHFMKL